MNKAYFLFKNKVNAVSFVATAGQCWITKILFLFSLSFQYNMCENKVEENKIRKDSVIYDIDHFFYIAYVHNKGILFFLKLA